MRTELSCLYQDLETSCQDIFEKILVFKDVKDRSVRQAFHSLLPLLANASHSFTKTHSETIMPLLLSQIRKERDAAAFEAIGRMALVAPDQVSGLLDEVFAGINDYLSKL